MARLLILETSQKQGAVALAQDERIVGERRLEEARRHARDLVPFVKDLLTEHDWRARDLDGVVVSLGPGSYTGLRVGVMSAKTLCYATGCTLLGIETFAALALQTPPECHIADVLEDAQQGRVYAQRFERQGAAWRQAEPLHIVPFLDWLKTSPREAWVTGPGLAPHMGLLPPDKLRTTQSAWRLRPDSLLRLGLERLRRGERDDPFALGPIYLRASEAEEKWKARVTPASGNRGGA